MRINSQYHVYSFDLQLISITLFISLPFTTHAQLLIDIEASGAPTNLTIPGNLATGVT